MHLQNTSIILEQSKYVYALLLGRYEVYKDIAPCKQLHVYIKHATVITINEQRNWNLVFCLIIKKSYK